MRWLKRDFGRVFSACFHRLPVNYLPTVDVRNPAIAVVVFDGV
jgi:hypothetical protein